MHWAHGGSLDIWIDAAGETAGSIYCSNAARSFRRVADVARQICSALSHAHEHGVVHADVKPPNALVMQRSLVGSGRLYIQLTDFGICGGRRRPDARVVGEAGHFDSAVVQAGRGTPGYRAPEQESGGEVGAAADVWGLTVTLCIMLSRGRWVLPSRAAEVAAACTANQWCVEQLEWLHGEQLAPVEALVRRALSLDCSARPSLADVCGVLDTILSDDPASCHAAQLGLHARTRCSA